MVDPGPHYLPHNVDLATSTQLYVLREELGWYDITLTADDTEDHAGNFLYMILGMFGGETGSVSSMPFSVATVCIELLGTLSVI